MKKQCIFFFIFLMISNLGMTAPIRYLKICELPGKGYFYVPDKDDCLNASTGTIFMQTASGTVRTETQMAKKVSNLEAQFKALEEAIKAQQ